MPKFIQYKALTYACAAYQALLEESVAIGPSPNPPDDGALVQAFEDPLPITAAHTTYPHTHSVDGAEINGSRKGSPQAARASPQNEPATKKTRHIALTGLAYTLNNLFNTKRFNEEFAMIAEACMSYLDDNHRCTWRPLDPHRKDFVPDTLQMVYVHMGCAPIVEIAFLEMASLYVEFSHGGCQWEHDCCHCVSLPLDGCLCPCCQRSSTIDYTTTDVILSRDVPAAVAYLHRTHPRLTPIEELAFRDLAEKVEDYQDFRGEYHHWSEEAVAAFREFSGPIMDYYHYENDIDLIEVAAFKDISAAVAGYMSYKIPPYFPKFLLLPAELRTEIYHQYLLGEFKDGKMCQHRHFDGWGNGCCVWEYPHVLVACDNHDSGFFPSPETASIPQGWLPALAQTCPQLLGEVVKHMLVYTERFDLKYMRSNPQFKSATWSRKLLDAIPEGGGQYAVKYLNFPHMSLFNKSMRPLAMTNPSIGLAMACRSLRKLDMTFHLGKYPGTLLHKFKLWSLPECENLRDIFLDGIYGQLSRGGQESDVATLIELGKWFVKEYQVGHERKIGRSRSR